MDYLPDLADQTRLFLLSLGFGFALGVLYDVFRVLRLAVAEHRRGFLIAWDIIYSLCCTALSFFFFLTVGDGALRAYGLLGEILGWLIYYVSFGAVALRVSGWLVKQLRRTFGFLSRVLRAPFIRFLRLLEKSAKYLRKLRISAKLFKKIYILACIPPPRCCIMSIIKMRSQRSPPTERGNPLQQNLSRRIRLLEKIESLLRKPLAKNRLISLVVLAAVPLFVLFVGLRILHGREAAARAEEQNQKLEQQAILLEAQNRHYLAVLNNDDPDVFRDYVIRTARERLGLSLPGDRMFIDRAFFKSNQ